MQLEIRKQSKHQHTLFRFQNVKEHGELAAALLSGILIAHAAGCAQAMRHCPSHCFCPHSASAALPKQKREFSKPFLKKR